MAAVAALRIGVDGAVSDVQLGAGGGQLRDLYREIGCDMVECVELTPGLDMWLDEEGLLKAEPEVNQYATTLAALFGFTAQDYFGNVVVTGGADDEGEMQSLAAGDADGIRSLLALIGRRQ